jgi:hypothetical protein
MNPLEDELAERFGRGVDVPFPDAEFNRLALAVFAYQWERNLPFQRYCRARGRTPNGVQDWREVPALPTAAFKEVDLTTVAANAARVVYVTSGTSIGSEKRGRHLLPDTRLYDASLLPNLKAHLFPDVEKIRMLVVGPSARYFPQSSLGHMNTRALEVFGTGGSGLFWDEAGPQFEALTATLECSERDREPVCLLGTAFGFVHLLDWLAQRGRRYELPPGSRIMDTGGYKGRSREVPKSELYRQYGERLGISPTHVVNEYGMTELGSQFYDRTLRDSVAGRSADIPVERRRKTPPPWVRVQIVDPETLAPLRAVSGRPGLLRFYDLANLHSVAAVQTDDLGAWRDDGFEILGRAAGAEPRGCSLAAEDFLTTH